MASAHVDHPHIVWTVERRDLVVVTEAEHLKGVHRLTIF